MDHELRILIEAEINKGKTIGNVNSALKEISAQVKKLNIKLSFDSSSVKGITKASETVKKISDEVAKQAQQSQNLASQTAKATNEINKQTKALLEAKDAQHKWNLEKERTSKQGIITQTWGNDKNNTKKQVFLDNNSNRIDPPYQPTNSNYLKDKTDLDKVAMQRMQEANARQAQYNSDQMKALKERNALEIAMYKGRENAEQEANSRRDAWDRKQLEHINAVRKQNENEINNRQKKAENYTNWWLKALKNQEQAEINAIANAQKKRENYTNWWTKALATQERAEIESAKRSSEAYNQFWQKALVNKRTKDQQTLQNLSNQTTVGNVRSTEGLTNVQVIDTLNRKYAELKTQIASLKNTNSQVTSEQLKGIRQQIDALSQLGQKQRELEQLTRQQVKAQQDVARIINTYGNKVDKSRLTQLSTEIKNLNIDSANFKARAASVIQEIKLIGDNAKIAAIKTKSFGESLGNAFRNMAMYAGAGSLFFGAIQALQNMVSTIIEVDSQLTQMKRVMDASTDFEQTMKTSIDLANEFGRSIQDVNENMISFARMGFNADDTAELAKVTTLFQNISDLTTEEAVNGITSALINFNISAQDSLKIADSINEVDNRFAVSSQDIVTSLNKSASAARTFGFSMNQVIGATAAIGTATRESGAIIGNSLKSILSRVTTNPKAVNALADIGINQKDVNGQQKQAFTILDELAGKWNKLTSSQQQNTAVNVAGVYQLNRLLAYLNNYQIALNATQAAENSAGSAMSENEKYMESLQAKIQQMKTAWDTLSITFGNKIISDSIILITGLLTTLTGVFNEAVDTVGALPVVLGLLWVAFTVGSVTVKTFFVNIVEATRGILGLGVSAGTSSASVLGLSVATGALKNSLRALAATSGVGLVLVALGFIAEKLMNQFVDAGASIEETETKIQKLNETNANITELKNMADEYDNLAQKTNLTGEEKNRLAIIESNLATKQGIVLSSLKNQTEAYKENAKAIKNRIALLETERVNQIRDAGLEYDQNAVTNQRNLENARKELASISAQYKEAEKNYLAFNKAKQDGESFKGRAKDFGLDESFNDQLSFGGGIDRIGEMLAEKYKELDEKNQKAQTAVQQGENKRAASLRNAFEINITRLGETIGKLSEADKALLDIYADIASSSSKSNAEIVNNLPQIITSIKLIDKSNIDNVTNAFERFTESGALTTEQLTNLQSKISAFNNQPTIEGTEEMIGGFQDASSAIENFFKKIDSYADDIGKLNQTIYDLSKGQSLNSQEVYELIKRYPELAGHIKKTTDGWIVEEKAIKNLRDAKIQLVKTDVESQKDMAKATVNATLQRLKMYGIEIKAINNVQDAINAKNKIQTETSPMIANPPIKPNDLNFANPFNVAFMNALKQKDQQSYNNLKNSLDNDKEKATSEALGAVNSYIDSNTELEKQLGDILNTVATKEYGITKDSVDKDKKTKKQKEYNDTISETNEILTTTLKRLKEIDAALEKLEGRRHRLKVGSDEYNNSLIKEQELIKEQIKLRENAKAEDLIPIKTTTTQKVAQGTTADGGTISNVDLSPSNNGISNLISNARNLQGNFVYKQVAGEFKGTYDQFVKQGISDCSQFVQEMYKQFLDTKLPRTAAQQAKQGQKVDRKDLQAGDLVFWNTTGKSNSHVGVYTSNGKAIQMGNHGLKEIPIDAIPNYEGARRIVSGGSTANIPSVSTKGNNTTTTKSADGKTSVKVERPSSQDLIDAQASNESELVKLYNNLYDSQVEFVQSIIKKSEEASNKIDIQIASSQRKQKTFSVDTPEYRKQAEVQSSLLEQQQKNLEERNKAIRDYIKKNNIVSGEFDDELASNSARWLELQEQRMGKAQEITDSYLTSYKNKLDDVTHSLDMSNAKMALMDEGSNDYNKEMANQIPLLEKQKELYSQQAKFIDSQLDNQKLEKSYRDQLLQDREALSVEWWKTAEAIKQINDALRKLKEERADEIIDDMKSSIEKQKDLALSAIDAEKEAEDERHNKRVKNIEEESNQFKKYIQDRINAYQRENATTDYESDLKKAIKDRDKIQAQLDEIALNNSASADKKRKDLKEQLASANENITKLQTDRERELVVQGLNDQLDSYNEYTDKAKENEDQSYDQFVKNIDSRKKKTEQSYNDMLNDEKKYYTLKQNLMSSDKTVVNSTVEEIKGFYADLFTYMNGASFETSKAFQNMSYTIQQALEKVNKYSSGDYSAIPTTDNKTTPATDLYKDTQKQNQSQAWSQYLNNKKQAEAIKAKMSKLNANSKEYKDLSTQFNSLKSSNEKLRNEYGFADLAYNILSKATAPVINSSARYNTGGSTGNWAGNDPKIAFVDKEETILNTPSTKNMVDSLKMIDDIIKNASQFIKNSQINSTTTGDTNIYVSIPNLTSVKDGTDLGGKLFESLNNKGALNKIVRG